MLVCRSLTGFVYVLGSIFPVAIRVLNRILLCRGEDPEDLWENMWAV